MKCSCISPQVQKDDGCRTLPVTFVSFEVPPVSQAETPKIFSRMVQVVSLKSEETGEQHKLKLYDFQPDGTGRLDWAAAKKAFGADLLEIKDEGTPGLLQEVGRIGLTIDTYKPEENILVIVGRRAQGYRVRPLRTYQITIHGPHKKKYTWTRCGHITLQALREEIDRHFPDAFSADYTLTWRTSNDMINDFEGTVSQWGQGDIIKQDLKLKLLSKRFSDFSRADGLEYLGFPREYEIHEAGADEFAAEDLADDVIVDGQTSTFGSILQHFAEDLCLRRSVLGNPEIKPSEQTRREIISPVLVLAVLLMTRMQLVPEIRVEGTLGKGPLDYAVIWEAFKIPISECRMERREDGEGQALAQIAAAREEYVRKRVKGSKRKRSEIDDYLPVPSTTILCTGTTYVFYRYHPAAGEAQPRRLVKSKEYALNLIGPARPETIKPQLKALVCAIVATLRFEKEQIKAALASKKLKLMP